MSLEKQSRLAFIDFLQGLLNLNHFERWSPQQAKQHPFITGEEFTGPFKPAPYTPRKPSHSPIKIHHPPPPPPQPTLPVIMDEASSPYMAPISEYDNNNNHRFFSGSSSAATTAYSSSLPNYYTHNSMFFPMRQSTENQPSASTSSSSIPPPRLLHHRGSYNGMSSLPRVLEPPDGLATCYEGMPTTTTTTASTTSTTSSNSIQPGIMIPPPPPTSTSTHTTTTSTSGRPRASTLGSMQVPPPIQLVSADVAGELPLFTTPRNHYPYRQHTQQQQQDSLFYPSSSSSAKQHSVTAAAASSVGGGTSDWDCWDKVDLERDGDWKEQVPHSRRSSYHNNHRRSNSSIQLSDMMPSRSHSMVHSLHRRVRGHPPPPYARQDLEWDGIISSSFEPALHHGNSHSNSSSSSTSRSSRQQRWSQHEKTGWTMA